MTLFKQLFLGASFAFLVVLIGGGWLWDKLYGYRLERARRAELKHWLEREYPDA